MNSKLYKQADKRWGSLPYPVKAYSFAHNACGCCSVLHCAIEIEKHKDMTPPEARIYMVQFATKGHGTLWNGITKGLEHYGFNVHWKQSDSMTTIFKVLANSLKMGVILFGKTKGPDGTVWTSGGHYIAFVDYKIKDGKHWFYLKDSGGRKHDGWWCYEKSMRGAVRQVWICTSLKAGYRLLTKKTTAKSSSSQTKIVKKTKTLKVGSQIRIKSGANQYGTTKNFAAHVYKTTYKVIEIRGNRVVFATKDGKTVMGAVGKGDCIVQ